MIVDPHIRIAKSSLHEVLIADKFEPGVCEAWILKRLQVVEKFYKNLKDFQCFNGGKCIFGSFYIVYDIEKDAEKGSLLTLDKIKGVYTVFFVILIKNQDD